jgi:hypothetical protein
MVDRPRTQPLKVQQPPTPEQAEANLLAALERLEELPRPGASEVWRAMGVAFVIGLVTGASNAGLGDIVRLCELLDPRGR